MAPSDWPWTGEIDVMELNGTYPHTVLQTLHYGPDGGAYTSGCYAKNIADGKQHTFAATWDETGMQMSVDSVCNFNVSFSNTTPFDLPSCSKVPNSTSIQGPTKCNPFIKGTTFVPIMNIAVSGTFFNPIPDPNTIPKTATMKISSVTLSPKTSFVTTSCAPTPWRQVCQLTD